MDIDLVKKIIANLYADIDGYKVSAIGRNRLSITDKTFTYGEVLPEQFKKILDFVNPQPGENFYDLGSGLGKPVFLASLFFDFKKSIGIELVEELFINANNILARYNLEIKPGLSDNKKAQEIKFINASFLDCDFSDADIIFTHSTCFSVEILTALTQKLEKLKPGTRLITVTKTIKSPFYSLIKSEEHLMNWGRATVYFYKKII